MNYNDKEINFFILQNINWIFVFIQTKTLVFYLITSAPSEPIRIHQSFVSLRVSVTIALLISRE